MKIDLPFSLALSESLVVLKKTQKVTFVNLANNAAKSFLISELQKKINIENLFWASTEEKAEAQRAASRVDEGRKVDGVAHGSGRYFPARVAAPPRRENARQTHCATSLMHNRTGVGLRHGQSPERPRFSARSTVAHRGQPRWSR